MSVTNLAQAAELTKLARTLGVDDAQLSFLADVGPDAIREFRLAASDRLFDSDGDKLNRIASAAKLVPAPVAAKAAAVAFGPLLTAAIASSVDPARGIAVAANLRVKFLARTAVELDPRRCAPILSQLPPKLAGQVAAHLNSAGEHLTLGRFVGAIPDAALRAAAAEIDDADLLRVAFLLEDASAIDHVVDVLADRLPGLLAAAGREGLWTQAFGLLASLGDAHRETMGNLAAQLDSDALAGLIGAAEQTQAWGTLLSVIRLMSIDGVRVFATNPAVQQPDTVAAVMDAALARDMWLDLLPLAGELPASPRSFLATRIVGLDPEILDDLVFQADDAELWAAMLPLVAVMSPEDVATVLAVPSLSDPAALARALDALTGDADVPDDVRALIIERGRELGVAPASLAG